MKGAGEVVSQKAMESLAGPWMPSLKYCSVTTAQKRPCCLNASARWSAPSTCPLILQVPCFIRHPSAARGSWSQPDQHTTDFRGNGPGLLEGLQDGDTSVLARRESDGLYYRAQIKQAPELGRWGKLLVEFEAPPSEGPKLPGTLQSASPEDVIQGSWALKHPLLPGDKVLAPWEPKQERYGPGTVVQGLETRDPQRACCTWWPLSKTLEATTGDHPEPELKPTAQLLELDNTRDRRAAAHVCASSSSSSSSFSSYVFSSEEEDLENDLKKAPPQRMMVDSTVNTDSSLFEKPLRQKVLSQPPWKYWKRNGPEPSYRRPGKESLKKLRDT
ncbi:uncharacterized protein C11orf16 homolog isoform X4 [Antechinus flavipes]|uniref:uncharacterized protein C11orf16 homolog isoform X4 n=1 Tax=Antechinus flavipes TaxID=38775 RepID=UPI0022355CAC|nr:uncharacterized protein C11orf16 homolog isoform X4 [Antechinus flavipes]